MGYRRKTVNHWRREYVRGVDPHVKPRLVLALLKRGITGTYHNVSRWYLPLYLAEFRCRHNNRNNEDIFGLAITGC